MKINFIDEHSRNRLSDFLNKQVNDMPKFLNSKIYSNNVPFNSRCELDKLKKYIDDYIDDKFYSRFFILPGLRDVGKTTLLYQVYEYLLKNKNISPNNILYFSCEDLNDLAECDLYLLIELYLKNYHDSSTFSLDEKVFLLIDDAEYDKYWAINGKILYDETRNIFMIFTGSYILKSGNKYGTTWRSLINYVFPFDYLHHLNFKYQLDFNRHRNDFPELLCNPDIEKVKKIEDNILNSLIRNKEYNGNDWTNYLFYGGFQTFYNTTDKNVIMDNIFEMTKKVVNTDMLNIEDISREDRFNANRLLRYLASQKSTVLSCNMISKAIDTSSSNVDKLLDILEKTDLILYIDSYNSKFKRYRNIRKYYFTRSSIKYALASRVGNTYNKYELEENLIENMIASKLNQLNREHFYSLTPYYNSNKDVDVNFIFKELLSKPVPIKIGCKKKDSEKLTGAINTYDSDFGIMVSNDAYNIYKEDDIIYISPKTFALL